MIDTAIPVLGLALVDSINPSALAVALYWLSQPSPVPRVLAYVAGIAVTYLTLGVALMLGFGSLAQALGHLADHPVTLGVQLVLGIAMFGYGVFAPKASASDPPPQRQPSRAGLVGMALLGVTITAVELTTAFPYFGALALMTSAQLAWPQWLLLLLVYNAIFVAPPLALVGLHALAGPRMRERFERWRGSLQRGARETMLWIVTLVGVALALDAFARLKGKPAMSRDDVSTGSQRQGAAVQLSLFANRNFQATQTDPSTRHPRIRRVPPTMLLAVNAAPTAVPVCTASTWPNASSTGAPDQPGPASMS